MYGAPHSLLCLCLPTSTADGHVNGAKLLKINQLMLGECQLTAEEVLEVDQDSWPGLICDYMLEV